MATFKESGVHLFKELQQSQFFGLSKMQFSARVKLMSSRGTIGLNREEKTRQGRLLKLCFYSAGPAKK